MPTTHTIGQSFIELTEADSTNNYAMAAAKDADAFHGLAWYTNNQTAGRGQRGHAWAAQPGENLALSVLLDTSELPLTEQFSIIVLAALAAYDLLYPIGKENLKIKWPNDIYLNDKKTVGILTESVIKGKIWQWTVIGIGINVNQATFGDEVLNRKATSLFQYTGNRMDTRELAQTLCDKLEARWQQLLRHGQQVLLDEYNRFLFKKSELVKYKKQDGTLLECRIIGADKDGKLHVMNGNMEESYSFGELELVLER